MKNNNYEEQSIYQIKTEKYYYFTLNNCVECDYDDFSQATFGILKEILKNCFVTTKIEDYSNTNKSFNDRTHFFAYDYFNKNKKSYKKSDIYLSSQGEKIITRTKGLDENLLQQVIITSSMYNNIVVINASYTSKLELESNGIYDIKIEYFHCPDELKIITKNKDILETMKKYFIENDKTLELY